MPSISSAFSDTVFIAGMTEDDFPSYHAKRDFVLSSHINNDWYCPFRILPLRATWVGIRVRP